MNSLPPLPDFTEIREYLAPGLGKTEAWMDQVLRSDIPLLDSTNRSIRETPGKMLRPMLALLCAGAAGQVTEDTFRYAASAELLHNATLLHDDVVDGAKERRGRPSVASVLGGTASVLVGDYWLVQCLQLVLSGTHSTNLVLQCFADTLSHLAQGELLQLQKSVAADTNQEDYLRIIYGKTASLFEASATSAVLSVGGDKEALEALKAYARNMGIAFQIRDDILDYAADEARVGKPVGIDLLEGKITQPLLCALEKAPAEAPRIRALVAGIGGEPSRAAEVRAFVQEQDGVADARKVAAEYLKNAVSALSPLSESKEKSYLASLAACLGKI